MPSRELENLVASGHLKREKATASEVANLVKSGAARLEDAQRTSLSLESRFDLAYNAAHALALAALRRAGYRSDNRYLVSQALEHSLGLKPERWRVLATAHGRRNRAEYEGEAVIDERLVSDTISVARSVLAALEAEATRA